MVGAAIKGLSKILRKGLRKSPVLGKYTKKPKVKPKPKPRYRTDPKTGQKFLNRRAPLSGVKGITKAPVSKSFVRGAITGSAASYMLTDTLKDKARAKETKAKLKEATEKHREEDKKKKEKRKDNYGGK
jgi:hypothetical protein